MIPFSRILSTTILLSVLLGACVPSQPTLFPKERLYTGSDGMPWWNDVVFYEIFVRSFYDTNGDGIGDLNGVTAKLDYLQSLGVGGLWLMPIHPSPSYHGYDVTDYYGINPDYGTMDDFRRLVVEAHKRGIRVTIDFVINHTSSKHPWFVESRNASSAYRDWYQWAEQDPGWRGTYGQSAWYKTDDGYYYGMFSSEMPDLNFDNPDVTEAIFELTRYWLEDVGVDGLRLDAIRHLVEDKGVQANSQATHNWLKNYRTFYKSVSPHAVTIGEVWDGTGHISNYIQGDELDLAFDFPLADAIIKSARTGNKGEFIRVLNSSLNAYPAGQFSPFLSNHDQNRVMSQFARNTEKSRISASLYLTLPGVPFVYYGEEIGMSGVKPDELIRTPMQWNNEVGAGFTSGTPWHAVNADVTTGVSVAAQEKDANSLLNHYRTLIRVRNQHPALRVGNVVLLETENPAIHAMLRISPEETVLVLINISDKPVNNYSLNATNSGMDASLYKLKALMGNGKFEPLTIDKNGDFNNFIPLSEIPAYTTLIFALEK